MATKKQWKYEADCKRVDALIDETLVLGAPPPWAVCARMVLSAARIARSRATPLVLHFVSMSAHEMLGGNSDYTRLCLNAALAVVSKGAMKQQLRVFSQCFSKLPGAESGPEPEDLPPQLIDLLSEVIGAAAAGKIMELPEGVSELEVAPGMKLHVIKKGLGKSQGSDIKELPPPSRWN